MSRTKKTTAKRSCGKTSLFGMWRDYSETKNVAAYIDKLRGRPLLKSKQLTYHVTSDRLRSENIERER